MKLKQFLTFGATGSAGNFTVSQWNGITVGKNKITRMTNPKSEAQQKTRKKRRIIGKLFSGLGNLIQASVETKVTGQSKFSQLLKISNAAIEIESNGDVNFIPLEMQFSKGSLEVTAPGATLDYTAGEVEIVLQPNNPATTSDTDTLVIMEVSYSEVRTRFYNTTETRPTTAPKTITYDALTTAPGDVFVFLWWTNANNTKSSNTTYIGTFEVV